MRKNPIVPVYRWIMYLTNPLGGGEWARLTSLESAKAELIEYGKNTGFYQDLTVYGTYGPTAVLYPYTYDDWQAVINSDGNPLDYPSYEVKSGPRGGVSITPV